MSHRWKWWWAVGVCLFGLVLAGCRTETRINRVAPHTYTICDKTSSGGLLNPACDGANAEHGIYRVCLPWHQSIVRIHKIRDTIYVTCGGPTK